MTHSRNKLIFAAIIVIGAVSYLTYAGAQKGWVYTLDVDAYQTQAQYKHQRTRLCGKVSADQLTVHSAALQANFLLCGKEKSIPVSYHGVIPDLFKAGCDVVVEGRENAAGTFESDMIMTKCASKYEPGAKK